MALASSGIGGVYEMCLSEIKILTILFILFYYFLMITTRENNKSNYIKEEKKKLAELAGKSPTFKNKKEKQKVKTWRFTCQPCQD